MQKTTNINKKTLIISFAFCLSTTSLLAQMVPLRFKNLAREKFNIQSLMNIEKVTPEISPDPKSTIDSFGLGDVVVKYKAATNYYSLLSSKYKTLADEKEESIENDFRLKRKELYAMLNLDDLDEALLKEIKGKFETLDQAMSDQMSIVHDLRRASREMDYKSRNLSLLKTFPVHNSVDAQMYYDFYSKEKTAQFLKNSIISFSNDGGKASIYNELYADYFGPFRIGVGALISNKETKVLDSAGSPKIDESSLQKDAVQRLLGGGGNVSFNFSYPLLGYSSADQSLSFKVFAAPKLSFDVPKLGTENKDYSLNYDLGVDGSIFYTGVLDVLTFYTNFRFSKIGGNSIFYDYLGRENGSFSFNQTSIGLALNSTFRISWNYYWGSQFVRTNFPSTIAFSVVPN